MEKFVGWINVDLMVTFWDVWEPVPYGINTNVSFTAVGDGFPDVPLYKLQCNLYKMANAVRRYRNKNLYYYRI